MPNGPGHPRCLRLLLAEHALDMGKIVCVEGLVESLGHGGSGHGLETGLVMVMELGLCVWGGVEMPPEGTVRMLAW